MKLQEFVSETLREIIAGVKEAQTFAAANDAQISPQEWGQAATGKSHARGLHQESLPITRVGFDVAVTSTDTTEKQAGAGVFVAGLGVGARGKSGDSSSCVSRVKFSVPLVLPVGKPK